MSTVAISVFIGEDLTRDFVWLRRMVGYETVASPRLDQTEPRPFEAGEAIDFVFTNTAGQVVKTIPATIIDEDGGRFNLSISRTELPSLKRRGNLTFHALLKVDGLKKRLFYGSLEITAS